MQRYVNSLKDAEAKLAALMPAGGQQGQSLGEGQQETSADDDQDPELPATDGEGDVNGQAGAAWEKGHINVRMFGCHILAHCSMCACVQGRAETACLMRIVSSHLHLYALMLHPAPLGLDVIGCLMTSQWTGSDIQDRHLD